MVQVFLDLFSFSTLWPEIHNTEDRQSAKHQTKSLKEKQETRQREAGDKTKRSLGTGSPELVRAKPLSKAVLYVMCKLQCFFFSSFKNKKKEKNVYRGNCSTRALQVGL